MSDRRRKAVEDDAQPTDWMRPLPRENLSDRAYSELRAALMRGQLTPGDQLRLRPISARFGISATPMREALTRLVVERALTLDARGTVTVPTLTRAQLMEIRAIRVDLEGRAAAGAALIATPDQIDGLAAIHDQISQAQREGRFIDAIEQNTRFHLTLCRMAALPICYEMVEGLWVRCGPILSHLYDAGVPADWEPHPHLRIVDALRAADPEAARAAIRTDIENGGQGLLDYVSN